MLIRRKITRSGNRGYLNIVRIHKNELAFIKFIGQIVRIHKNELAFIKFIGQNIKS